MMKPKRVGATPGLLSDVPALVAAIAGISVVLAVVRQAGYFMTVDSELMALLSMENVLQNSLLTLPLAIFSVFSSRIWFAIAGMIDRDSDPRDLVLHPAYINFLSASFWRWVILGLSVVALALCLVVANWPAVLLGLGAVAFFPIFGLAVLADEVRPIPYRIELTVLSYLIVTGFLLGAFEAKDMSATANYSLQMVGEDVAMPVKLLRTSSDFLIVMDAQRKVMAVPDHEIRLLKKLESFTAEPVVDLAPLFEWAGGLWPGPRVSPTPKPSALREGADRGA